MSDSAFLFAQRPFPRGCFRQFENDILEALALDGGEVYEDKLRFFLDRYFGVEKAREIRGRVSLDLAYFREMDPASTDYSETQILSVRRGMAAIAAHRVFQEILALAPELLYDIEVIAKYVQKDTNVEIHPQAAIGAPFAIDHGHGTVIGATAIVGKKVFIYHGVTLGASGRRSRTGRRHPRVGDDVFFGNGSQALGPCVLESHIKIASGSIVVDSFLGEGARVGPRVRITGVVVPAGTRALSADLENTRRYWALLPGEEKPRWATFEPFDVTGVD